MKQKKGLVSLYIVFIIIAIVIVFLSAVFAPLATDIATQSYAAGYDIMLEANESLNLIEDNAIKDSIQASINSAAAAQNDNVTYTTALYKYGFVLVIVIAGLVLFMYSRQLIEVGDYRGGFV